MSKFNTNMSQVGTRRSKNLAVLALMLALTIFFCFYPIAFPGGVTLALMILPLLIVAQGYDFKMTIVLAIMLAVVNQIAWYTTKAGGPMAPIWQNPLVCMVPRIAIGVVSYFVGYGLRKAFLKPKYRLQDDKKILTNGKQIYSIDYAITTVCTALGVVTNTFLCGFFTVVLYNGKVLSNSTKIGIEYILTWFGINFVIEIIAFALLVPPIIMALRKANLIPQPVFGKEVILEESSQDEVGQIEVTQQEAQTTAEENKKNN